MDCSSFSSFFFLLGSYPAGTEGDGRHACAVRLLPDVAYDEGLEGVPAARSHALHPLLQVHLQNGTVVAARQYGQCNHPGLKV